MATAVIPYGDLAALAAALATLLASLVRARRHQRELADLRDNHLLSLEGQVRQIQMDVEFLKRDVSEIKAKVAEHEAIFKGRS